MKDKSTLLAIGGVIGIAVGTLILSGLTQQVVDSELMKLSITGLLGFAAGGVVGTVSK